MDEILLTPREIELETERAIAAWHDSRPEQVPSREEFVLAWGCRAQVRTMVEWMEKRNNAPAFYGLDGFIDDGDLLLHRANWELLKMAAGEGA